MNIEQIQHVALAAAYKSSGVLLRHFGKITEYSKKGDIDLVTQADTESENVIIKTIRSEFPRHGILAEESGEDNSSQDNLWIIDPLDGTTNFTHQIGCFCVSIAYANNSGIVCGVVLNPVTGELFTAEAGKGARLNGSSISVSKTETLTDSLVVTGFPYNVVDILPEIMTRLSSCIESTRGVRRLGSAAMDLCYVACGRFEGFWEQNLKPWDTAAGWLIAKEAGATITDFTNGSYTLDKKEILATNGRIHDRMLQLMKLKETE